ncbi:hypothetical protein K474DRAFT_136394 [Panus rudis PR-1116 ss-1]|nr:hypothetical protein K474DRAFT_136394 [Panus rudis PR-1116 ss-1]
MDCPKACPTRVAQSHTSAHWTRAIELAKQVPTLRYLRPTKPGPQLDTSWRVHRGEHGLSLETKTPYNLEKFGMGDVSVSYY